MESQAEKWGAALEAASIAKSKEKVIRTRLESVGTGSAKRSRCQSNAKESPPFKRCKRSSGSKKPGLRVPTVGPEALSSKGGQNIY